MPAFFLTFYQQRKWYKLKNRQATCAARSCTEKGLGEMASFFSWAEIFLG